MRMVAQGIVPLIEKALNTFTGHGNQAIREKGLYTLGYLSKLPTVRGKITTAVTLDGVCKEFHSGTDSCKETILQMLVNLHGGFGSGMSEREFCLRIRDQVLYLLENGPWNMRNLCIKVICVLYRENEDRLYMVEKGAAESVFAVMEAKSQDLQEAAVVILLHLCVHPDIPFLLLHKGCAKVCVSLLHAGDPTIRELAVVLLKALLLYNSSEVERVTPVDKQYLLKRDLDNPKLFGEEYGGLIQE
jgi:hypothetical protein